MRYICVQIEIMKLDSVFIHRVPSATRDIRNNILKLVKYYITPQVCVSLD